MSADPDRKKWMHATFELTKDTGRRTTDDTSNRAGDFNQPQFIMKTWYVADGVQTTKPDLDTIRLEDAETVGGQIDLLNYTRE